MAKHGEPTVQDNTITIHSYVARFQIWRRAFNFFRINFNLIIDKI